MIEYSANSILAIFRTRTDSIMFITHIEKREEWTSMPLDKYGDLSGGIQYTCSTLKYTKVVFIVEYTKVIFIVGRAWLSPNMLPMVNISVL